MRRAFITGIAGQDGSYLTELLLEKNYEVHGLLRRQDSDAPLLQHLIQNADIFGRRLQLHSGDIDNPESIRAALEKSAPDEIYHLASQTDVGKSFKDVEKTCRVSGFGALHMLEAIRNSGKPARFFHASSSEIFGNPETAPQNELTPIAPVTPYGCAKAFATQLVRVYRKTFGLFAVNGILFNHESPRRGYNFVTRKICRAAAAIKCGKQSELLLGDTSAQRDWGDARDYVQGMWLSMQHGTPEDFVFATGQLHTVQDVVETAFSTVDLDWRKHVRVDQQFIRPAEPHRVVGNAEKAGRLLNWRPQKPFADMIKEMAWTDLEELSAPSK